MDNKLFCEGFQELSADEAVSVSGGGLLGSISKLAAGIVVGGVNFGASVVDLVNTSVLTQGSSASTTLTNVSDSMTEWATWLDGKISAWAV